MREITTLKWEKGNLLLLDQTLLPHTVTYVTCKSLEDVYQAIQTMIVRGAPAIGVAAGYGMVLAAGAYEKTSEKSFFDYLKAQGEYLKSSRPTAVNLMWAVDRIVKKAEGFSGQPFESVVKEIEAEAIAIHEEDKQTNRNIGMNVLSLLKDGDTVLTLQCRKSGYRRVRDRTFRILYGAGKGDEYKGLCG